MEDNLGFEGVLEEALTRKGAALDAKELPQLKEQFRVFQSSFQGIHQLLLRKGLIHEDPYQYDMKASEVSNPPEGSFLESEKTDQMSIRLATYGAQLDFLNNYYQFSIDFLNMGRIKRLLSFIKYFNWQQMTESAPGLNTRTLYEMLESVRKGNDSFSTGIVNDGLTQIEKTAKAILTLLKEITFYHKECYKLDIRKRVMPSVTLNKDEVFTNMDDSLKQIKRSFALEMGDRPFYPDLIQEILNEDYAGGGENLRQELLKKLDTAEEKKEEQKKSVSFKGILMEGVRVLSTVSMSLDDAVRKLQENNALLQNKRVTVWTQLRDWFRTMFKTDATGATYDVEYFDPVSAMNKTESIDFNLFCEDVSKKARILTSVSIKTSQTYRRLESAKDEQVYAFLTKNFEDMQAIHRRLSALDAFFKGEVAEEDREKVRGIKVELLNIKDTMIRVNQKKHEYISQKDELEQMKKLGIKTDIS
jgi:hypothetical protein